MAMANGYVVYLLLFLSIAVAITKWVHNPFTNDAIAVAVGHHVNSLKNIEFPLSLPLQCERALIHQNNILFGCK